MEARKRPLAHFVHEHFRRPLRALRPEAGGGTTDVDGPAPVDLAPDEPGGGIPGQLPVAG